MLQSVIGIKPFLVACIAAGDVLIMGDFSNLPYDPSLGLRDIQCVGNLAGWQRVLNGELLMTVAPYPNKRVSGQAQHISFRRSCMAKSPLGSEATEAV